MRTSGRRTRRPFKVQITHEDILADLMYPAAESKAMARRRRDRKVRGLDR